MQHGSNSIANNWTGEGNFDDKNAAGNGTSGTATPVAEPETKGAKKRKIGGKKAKTLKQRLALADGQVDM